MYRHELLSVIFMQINNKQNEWLLDSKTEKAPSYLPVPIRVHDLYAISFYFLMLFFVFCVCFNESGDKIKTSVTCYSKQNKQSL